MTDNASTQSPRSKALARLKIRHEFLRVAGTRRRASAAGMVIQAAAAPSGSPDQVPASRVGFTVTKKVGNAVVRNRAKRRLRAIAAELMPVHAAPGYDYVLIGRPAAATCAYTELKRDCEQALRRLGLWAASVAGPAAEE